MIALFLALIALAEIPIGGTLPVLFRLQALSVGLFWCASARRPPEPRPSAAFVRCLLTGLAPWIGYSNLMVLAMLAQHTIGHWPQPTIDNPKWINGGTAYDMVFALSFWTGWSLWIGMLGFPFALWTGYDQFTRLQRIFVVWLGVSGVAGFFAAFPLIEWWLD